MAGGILRSEPSGFRFFGLLTQLVAQEIRLRYLGSVLGLFWLILVPLLTLVLYSVVFSTFLKARWGAQEASTVGSFALVLFPGLLVFNYFAECVNRAPSLVVTTPNYVKKVVFPLPLLSVVPILTALLQFLVGICVWCAISVWLGSQISWKIILMPVLLVPFMILVLGIMWILSALGVYIRDLISFVPLITQAMMFMSPVLYPVENVPENLRWVLFLNPLTFVVEGTRMLLMSTADFPWAGWSIYTCIAVATLVIGWKLFDLLRPGFADVI